MNQITHEQAQSYLQSAADRPLSSNEKAALDSHLEGCAACRAYANTLGKLEGALQHSLHRRWDGMPVSLSMEKILKQTAPTKFTFQRALSFASAPILAAVIVAIVMMMSPSRSSSVSATDTPIPTASALAVPTPSLQQVTASLPATECGQVIYTVQPDDTLKSIAEKFGVSMEAIREANPLPDEDVIAYNLIIPLCDFTPSLTPATTLTYTVTPYTVTAARTP